MESSNINALFLICILFIFSATPILGCAFCGTAPPMHTSPPKVKPPIRSPPVKRPIRPPPVKPPIRPPPIKLPPVTVPPAKPPMTLPPIVLPPVTLPPIVLPLPPIVIPPGILPPIFKPPVTPPPVTPTPILTPPPPPANKTCPIDTLKLGTCVDLLGGLVHTGLGDAVVNECCPVLQGLVENEAAVCLCTTLKQKLLNLDISVPLALQLLATCGKTPPPGYTCSQ